MNLTPVTTPKVIKQMFPKVIWDISTKEKVLYLTFDDGPTPKITNWVLQTLEEYNAKATFFCIGKNIEEHPEIFKAIIDKGHAIGNHTNNHLKGWKTNTKDYLNNTLKAQKTIDKLQTSNFKLSIKNPKLKTLNQKLFRPPYGQITPKQITALREHNFKVVMWSVLSIDWNASISKETCLQSVLKNAKNGSVIVFHDSIKAAKNMQYALPKVLDYFSEKGYVFKRIPE